MKLKQIGMPLSKTLAVAAAILLAMTVSLAYADEVVYSVWDPNGSGTWADASRWKDGIKPSESGNVLIDKADAYVTDADYAILSGLTRLRFQGKSSLDMRFDEDHASFSVNSVKNAESAYDESTLIKSGSGTLVHSSLANGFFVDRFIVTNGTLKLDVMNATATSKTMLFGSYATGRLIFNAKSSDSTYCDIRGLVGDGAVTNAVASPAFRIFGEEDASVSAFSGTLEGSADITLVNSYTCQDFTGPDAVVARTVRLFGGVLGVKSFGTAGSSGTLGPNAETFAWMQGGGVRYLGDSETTNKKFMFGSSCTAASFDAGVGNVTFAGEWNIRGLVGSAPVYLRGTNTNPAVISGTVNALSGNVIELVKQGSGTWRLTGSRGDGLGTISVENGTLEYSSVSNKGISCSLGRATRLVEPGYGELANLTTVPWTIRLGTHSTTGVFAYVGADDVSCTSRLFVVRGTGLVRSDTSAALYYVGATSYDSRGGKLILEGNGNYDNFSDVTNGVGALVVEKREAGTWTLGGNIDVGGVFVKDGVLRIANSNSYRWFRFTAKKLWGDEEPYLQISQLGLYDESGNQQNLNLVRSDESKARAFTLSPGYAAWNHEYVLSGTDREINKLFTGADGLMSGGRGKKVYPNPNDSSTWISFTMRLANGSETVRYYDVKSHQGFVDGQMNTRELKQWMLEGSVDGRDWRILDEQSFTSNPVSGNSSSKRWYSCDQTGHDASHKGYLVGNPPVRNIAVGSVSVASGATLEADMPVEIGKIAIDAAGGGTLKNFTLASDNGMIEYGGTLTPGASMFVPMTFTDVSGLENIRNWVVIADGVPSRRWRARGFPNGIRFDPKGTVMNIR